MIERKYYDRMLYFMQGEVLNQSKVDELITKMREYYASRENVKIEPEEPPEPPKIYFPPKSRSKWGALPENFQTSETSQL